MALLFLLYQNHWPEMDLKQLFLQVPLLLLSIEILIYLYSLEYFKEIMYWRDK